MGVCSMGCISLDVHLMGVHPMDIRLISVYLMGVHLIGHTLHGACTSWADISLGVHFMGVVCVKAFRSFNLGVWGKSPYTPPEKDVAKSRITEEIAKATRERLRPTTQIEDLSDVDFVIEAVPEIPSLKAKIFAQLAEICPKHAILATNTSSISITKIAAATTKDANDTSASSRVISTHFMNPVPVQKGVEIISGLQTSQSTVDAALDFVKKMGKVPSVSADSPGFLANRILMPYINEAIICLETGVGQKEDIDNIMKNGTNVPMGPLQLADFIGLDTCLAIMETLYQGLGDSKYRPSVLLRQYVDAGWLGKKSGKGFYNY
jgi:3-hydroxybutyryl-CoA dehydrogenase